MRAGFAGGLGAGFVLLLALLVAATPAHATETPVAAYSFDEGEGSLAADSSGENDGTIEGATWAGGKYGTALRFDNEAESLVSIPNDASLQLTTAFTLEAWVRPQYTQHWLPVLTKETPGFMSYQLYAGGETPGKAEGYVSPENGKYTAVSSPESLPVRTWTHLALTCDGEEMKLYLDGELVDTAEECDVQSSSGDLLVGGNEVFSEYLNGLIDEVRLYDRALSPEEIEEDMASAIETPPSLNPIAAYSFDEGEGAVANDVFGENHGAIEGAEWVGGKYGTALHFDNEDEAAVTIPHSPELELSGAFTLEAWVRPDHSQYWTPVLAKQTDDFFGYALYANGETQGTPEGYVAQQDWEFSEAKAEEVEPRAWTHLALSCDGETLRLYVDGALADTGSRCSAQSSGGALQIGANEVFNEWFNGTIDEVRIYNRALSAEKIEETLETPIQEPPSEDPIAAYSFDEGEGEVAHDTFGASDGTIDGAEWVEEGKFGAALRFDREAEDSVEIPASLDLDLSDDFTLSAWVKPEVNEYWMPVVVRETPAYHSYALYAAGEAPSKPQGITAERDWEPSDALAEEALTVGQWAHLTLTSDGENLKLFVDGELVDSAPASSAQHTDGVLRIGGHEAWGYYFDGLIDEVRVYGRAVAVGAPHCEDIEVGAVSGKERRVRLECHGKGKLEYEIEEAPEDGTITELDSEAGTLTYTPEPSFAGEDSFRLSASSALGQSNEALATLKVCSGPMVEASGQAYDPERPGVRLSIFGSPAGEPCEKESEPIESLRVYVDEELVFSEERDCDDPEPCEFDSLSIGRSVQLPYAKVLGEHDFEVRVKDRMEIEAVPLKWKEETNPAATVSAVPPPSKDEGNPGECDTPKNRDAGEEDEYKKQGKNVIGTPCADIFIPYAGKTSYYGGGGNDVFRLGGELNRVFGQDGADTIYSGRGNDEVFGGGGNDRIFAGSGDDLLQGGNGNDFLAGTSGADDIKGGEDKDFVQGGGTTDTLNGGPGENTISFADGVTPGFEFNPELPVVGFPAGREGRGVYVFLNESGTSVLDNAEMALYGGGTEGERAAIASEFANVIGTPFADVIIAGNKANLIDGGGGTDIIEGGGGDDEIYGGADGDYIDGGSGQSAKPVKAGPGEDICVNGTPEKTECEARKVEEGLAPIPELIAIGTTNPDDPENDSALYLRGTPKKESVVSTWQVSEGKAEAHFVTKVGEFDTALDGLGVSGCEVTKTVADCPMAGISSLVIYGGGNGDLLKANNFPVAVSVNLLGGEGGDRLFGGEKSEDILVDGPGAEGVDQLRGGGGDDTLIANEGKDIMVGAGGSDLFVSSAICEGDVIAGGFGGRDNASWAQLAGPPEEGNPGHREDPPYGVEVGLPEDNGKASPRPISSYKGPCATPGAISGINHLEGSSTADFLEGNEELNIVLGRNGADWLRGEGDDDVLLANNGDPGNEEDEAKRLDTDEKLECGDGTRDVLRYSTGDKPLLKEATDCERKISSEDVNGRTSSIGGAEVDAEARSSEPDERTVGALDDPDAQAPAAFYRLDDTSGTEAANWSDDELPGSYQGGVTLAEPGAIESSEGVSLDGANDYIDLTDALDPAEFEVLSCGYVPSGFAVEMWVKFDTESSSRETLFSRAEDGYSMSVYRDADGHIEFSVANPIEAPTVSSDEAVGQGSWHHVVAVVEEVSEGCPSFAEAPSPGGDPGREGNRMAIYLDGFPTSLWVSGSPFPESMPFASSLVGAEDGGGGLTNWLDGTVDGVALYTDALSETEIGNHLAISDAPPLDVVLLPEFDLTDSDEDGLRDGLDNCAEIANPDQADEDLDGVGDACEEVPDEDEDGVGDEDDNCPEEPNALQEDENEDGVGDACEE